MKPIKAIKGKDMQDVLIYSAAVSLVLSMVARKYKKKKGPF